METNQLFKRNYATFVVLFIALFALSQQVQAQEKYDVAIAGTWITSENCNDLSVIPGVSGTVSYDAENRILTLKNAKIDGGSANAIYSQLDGLTVKVAGSNNLTSAYTSTIQFTKPMSIAGGGTLNVENPQGDAIYANKTSLIVDACTLNAKGGNYGIVGEDGKNGEKLTIRYATVTAEGKNDASIGCFAYLTIVSCAISQPAGAAFDTELHGIAINGELVKEKISIDPTVFQIWIAGKPVTIKNCENLSVMDGIEGTVKYDPRTKTLTLENATINTTKYYGILNFIDGVTIRLAGNNTIISENNNAIYNNDDCVLNIVGDATLKLQGATESKDKASRQALQNHGLLTISGCTIEASAGINGLSFGEWKFDRCNIRTKASGDEKYEFAGSMAYMSKIPTFVGCAITAPTGTQWKEFNDEYGTCYSLVDANGKVVTDWVTISTDPTAIGKPAADATQTAPVIYSLGGIRLSDEPGKLPKGIYIVNGKKVAKR
ncbi:hypothetical protein JCM15124A_04650 [Prevotella falsenii]